MLRKVLECRRCGYRTVCGRDDLVARLRIVGQLRRDKDPDESIVEALLAEYTPLMTCPGCKEVGLKANDADDEWDDDGDWQAAVLCEICRQPIDPERLEFLPETKRCTECQHKSETGTLPDEDPEFCSRCGALVELRVSRGSGITRYKRFCTGGCRGV
ncbi:TraR/DksA C4-type zinc finger protein [Aeoliella sp. ICT_H6.2]|uniref:TraR/DksA C4-type zinc finger protein n=1 Tax=Aeoliella straminimaris TaxID=2954799 RepID=A0A9X2JJL9_9BACT|nr:TraR/DksA C4-type zinc finger protein [Aeoliella straminimaris]MCO6048071.1 TraR/DksA C4-type zinc finger protein [Aeoliella straminimaris]